MAARFWWGPAGAATAIAANIVMSAAEIFMVMSIQGLKRVKVFWKRNEESWWSRSRTAQLWN
jgi:hypothetical protein